MGSGQQGKGMIAFIGVMAAVVVAALFGVLWWNPHGDDATPILGQTSSQNSPDEAPQNGGKTEQGASDSVSSPSFDVVRVEPNGESVIAGRGAPGATIEMLRDGAVHARTAADQSGLFALVPPPLPPGSHQVVLQSIAPDGTRQRSKDSVTIVVSSAGATKPLVTLASPDKPTVVLSSPEPPDQKTANASGIDQNSPQQAGIPKKPETETADSTATRPEVKIVTVEAEEGRLIVSGQAAPGATVRLYLNDAFIAPGGVGGDGKVSFSIGKGVRSGDYRVRLDDVDPVSGGVKSRAEVAFAVPPSMPVIGSTSPETAGPAKPDQTNTLAQGQQPSSRTTGTIAAAPEAAPPSQKQDGWENMVLVPDINTTIVSRGDNLWRISQRIYGKGLRYTVIYGANQRQIRNPNLIYPGQVFVVPTEGASRN